MRLPSEMGHRCALPDATLFLLTHLAGLPGHRPGTGPTTPVVSEDSALQTKPLHVTILLYFRE
jgi:hypothetical protein